MLKAKVIALSASLRNARWGKGTDNLIELIQTIPDKEKLFEFVGNEARVHYDQFLAAGRSEGVPFDKLYKNLRKLAGKKGLCNSEVGMVVALWAAYQEGCEIDYIPLSSHFGPTGKSKHLDALKEKLITADGLLLCTPVYFGDRSSPASDFIEFIRKDAEIIAALSGKPMSGVAVGAKRNGGQETALIYQLLEMTDIGMLGLGNDSETTSQYGGTILAGDIGTAADDIYGLNTTTGTGRRLSRIAKQNKESQQECLQGKLRVMFWILQDSDKFALKQVKHLIDIAGDRIDAQIMNVVDDDIGRCIACDICPVHVGTDAEYRCIITRKSDGFARIHESFLDFDMIVPVAFSPNDRTRLQSVYQRFIERTRYLRRGDYLFSDVAIMPLVYEDVGATENLHIRLLTSLIRHHTIMLRSNVGYIHNDKLLNSNDVDSDWLRALDLATKLTISRLSYVSHGGIPYSPVGYVLSTAADKELSVTERRVMLHEDREKRRIADARLRLTEEPESS